VIIEVGSSLGPRTSATLFGVCNSLILVTPEDTPEVTAPAYFSEKRLLYFTCCLTDGPKLRRPAEMITNRMLQQMKGAASFKRLLGGPPQQAIGFPA